ncbi:MAG TPA: hypothetical protein VK724_22330, partial [Bryobacteraceae bacterium]|nr:hypothetical protein [Bryobacteraceae bacterium]
FSFSKQISSSSSVSGTKACLNVTVQGLVYAEQEPKRLAQTSEDAEARRNTQGPCVCGSSLPWLSIRCLTKAAAHGWARPNIDGLQRDREFGVAVQQIATFRWIAGH